jgi:DNA-binding transcriptional LysR family regulator
MLLERIELFVSVAKHQKLAKTAREMHVSPSSVCQRLKCLENDLGAKLYKKTNEGIELTDAGQTLLTAAGEILTRIDTLKTTLGTASKTSVQSLIVGGTYSPTAKYLPSAIAGFQKTHPNVKLTFHTFLRSRIEEMLRESRLDIALIQNPSKYADMNMEAFAVDKLRLFAPSAHPLVKKRIVGIKELAETPLIVRDGLGGTEKMLKRLTRRGVNPNVVLRCVSPDAVKAAVLKNMGVGILFYRLIEDDVKRRTLSILNIPDLPVVIGKSYIVYSKHKTLSPAAVDFLSILRSMKQRERNLIDVAPSGANKKLTA